VVVLLVVLTTGSALAINGYTFFSGSVDAEVREAIVVGAFDSWDNLHPYGSDVEAVWADSGAHDDGTGVLGDVRISIAPDGDDAYKLTIATIEGYEGAGFVAGEWVVIPINLRNGSSVELTLGATASVVGLDLDYCWEGNAGTVEPITEESGQTLCREYKAVGAFESLNLFAETIDGYGGKSGSAVVGAEVLFVKITVPPDVTPGSFINITFSLARGVVPNP